MAGFAAANKRWKGAEVETLIAIWGDQKIQAELDGVVRNKSIYQKISKKLEDVGYFKDWKQCKDKIKNLKNDYKKAKAHNNKSGNGRKSFIYYKQLDIILGTRPIVEPLSLLESNVADDDEPFDSSNVQLYTADEFSENDQESESDSEEEQIAETNCETENGSSDTNHAITINDSDINTTTTIIDDTGTVEETTDINEVQAKPKQKGQTAKKSTFEKATKEVMETFLKYQEKSEELFYERERKRREEERKHEEKIMSMLVSVLQPNIPPYYMQQPLAASASFHQHDYGYSSDHSNN